MKLFKRLFLALNEESVEYLVGGGIAVNLYGIERATADIDIILNLETENTLKFANVAKNLSLQPRIPVTLDDFLDASTRKAWADSKDMVVLAFMMPYTHFSSSMSL